MFINTQNLADYVRATTEVLQPDAHTMQAIPLANVTEYAAHIANNMLTVSGVIGRNIFNLTLPESQATARGLFDDTNVVPFRNRAELWAEDPYSEETYELLNRILMDAGA